MEPKQIVLALYAAYGTGDPDRIAALLHDEVVWVVPPGNATAVALGMADEAAAGSRPGADDLDRDLIVDFMAHNFSRCFADAANDITMIVADGDTVVVEQTLTATLPNGRPYVNDYCFVYRIREGRIVRIREHMDTRGGWVQFYGSGPGRQLLELVTGPV